MSLTKSKPTPINYARYQRTGNNAIDLVAQAIGYALTVKRPIRHIVLSGAYYELFKAGTRVLMERAGRKMDFEEHDLFFDGVAIVRGGRSMFENLVIEYMDKAN